MNAITSDNTPATLTALCAKAVNCRQCFTDRTLNLQPPTIDIAQPRWVGPRYSKAQQRVLILMLNPGSGETRADSADQTARRLIRAFARGRGLLVSIFKHQERDMPNWGRGRSYDFYTKRMGLKLDDIALGNLAWCATKGNKYPSQMLANCYREHTQHLLTLLQPDVVVLSGNRTHRFLKGIRQILAKARIVCAPHFAHRNGTVWENRQLSRVRNQIARALKSHPRKSSPSAGRYPIRHAR